MAEFLLDIVVQFIFEFLASAVGVLGYATGRVVVPLVSLGRVRAAPLWGNGGRKIQLGMTRLPGQTVILGDGWTIIAGLAVWVVIAILYTIRHNATP